MKRCFGNWIRVSGSHRRKNRLITFFLNFYRHLNIKLDRNPQVNSADLTPDTHLSVHIWRRIGEVNYVYSYCGLLKHASHQLAQHGLLPFQLCGWYEMMKKSACFFISYETRKRG